jgi:hypothetical protein
MLRAERPRSANSTEFSGRRAPTPHEVLLAIAPPPRTSPYAVYGWPEWLVPAYRSGAQRPDVHLLEEEG